jgi:hypothetical protein
MIPGIVLFRLVLDFAPSLSALLFVNGFIALYVAIYLKECSVSQLRLLNGNAVARLAKLGYSAREIWIEISW